MNFNTHTCTRTYTQTVSSGLVTTAMSNARRVGFYTPDPVSYARAAVATIGTQNYTHGYWSHALQVCKVIVAYITI